MATDLFYIRRLTAGDKSLKEKLSLHPESLAAKPGAGCCLKNTKRGKQK
jgi:hypothetical protein